MNWMATVELHIRKMAEVLKIVNATEFMSVLIDF